jgi:hypothetical protein
MHEYLLDYAARSGIMILAMSFVVLLLAAIQTTLEFISPIYSGVGPWYPMLAATFIVLVFACFLLILELVATLISRFRFISKMSLIITGVICALGAVEPLIARIFHTRFGLDSLEFLFLSAAIIGAISIRFLAGRASA